MNGGVAKNTDNMSAAQEAMVSASSQQKAPGSLGHNQAAAAEGGEDMQQ